MVVLMAVFRCGGLMVGVDWNSQQNRIIIF